MSKLSVTITEPFSRNELKSLTDTSKTGRKGPVFLEICLDVTAMEIDEEILDKITSSTATVAKEFIESDNHAIEELVTLMKSSTRPLILVGGGLDFSHFKKLWHEIETLKIPVATTWNAADYLDSSHDLFAGRPNTYGMRWANTVIQQSDLLITFGARLGLQQTGFAWQEFVPEGKIIRIELDEKEIALNQPQTYLDIHMDAGTALSLMLAEINRIHLKMDTVNWLEFIKGVRESLPIVEDATFQYPDHVNPFELVSELSTLLSAEDKVIPCSSGGAYTTMMQAFEQKNGQLLTNNKGLASMGYGLAGAIGTSVAHPENRTVLVEGDGGFAQNLSELGTVQNRELNLKIFIFSNMGYASIRVSQKAYFAGAYIGCDAATGVGLPNWEKIFGAFGIPSIDVTGPLKENIQALDLLKKRGPAAFIVKVHPDQSFLPKVTSKIFSDGKMKSNPIHLMQPELPSELASQVFKYLPEELRK